MKFLLLALPFLFAPAASAAPAPLDVPQSSLTFTGHAFLHDFKGEAKDFRGSAWIEPNDPSLVQTADIFITSAKLTTFENERDRHMDAWLHVDANPVITFHLARVIPLKGDPTRATVGHPAQFLVSGQFTLNQTTRPLEAVATGWRDGQRLSVTGATKIDTLAYNLPIVKQLFLTVDKDVDVRFHLVFDLPLNLSRPAFPAGSALR